MRTVEELEALLETTTRERDEARAKIERMTKDWHTLSRTFDILEREYLRADRERDEARAEVQRLTDERDELLVRVANQDAELRATREAYADAYRRGAEAMREACAVLVSNEKRLWLRSELIADLRTLPIPEEP